jgi:hypothetical protein
VSSVFLLRALAAWKMLQVPNYLRCYAAEKPAIRARRSETNPANSQIADKPVLCSLSVVKSSVSGSVSSGSVVLYEVRDHPAS